LGNRHKPFRANSLREADLICVRHPVIQIDLRPSLYRRAVEIAHKRNKRAWRGPTPAAATEAEALELNLTGTPCEAAMYQLLGEEEEWVTWNDYLDDISGIATLPELKCLNGLSIDVKGTDWNQRGLVAKVDGVKPHWAYPLVGAREAPRYLFIGWAWGRELAARKPEVLVEGRGPVYRIEQASGLLRSPASFLQLAGNSFWGQCGCGLPGMYYAREHWFCEAHR
jgi:hypothetical protein